MSDLTFIERKTLEDLFQMGGGYVLDFSNRTFQEFVADAVHKDIEDQKYNYSSCSKANRLRQFWNIEPNHIVGSLVRAMVDYASTLDGINQSLIPERSKIADRLLSSSSVLELDVIQPLTEEPTFEALARSVHDAIENNKPEDGLDRLHTFVVKYIRTLCKDHGIVSDKKPLHSIFGEYIKYLKAEGSLESEMGERILKSYISTPEAFNEVRNKQSLAHDNPILNYDESILIYEHVCSLIRFIKSIEIKEKAPEPNKMLGPDNEEISF